MTCWIGQLTRSLWRTFRLLLSTKMALGFYLQDVHSLFFGATNCSGRNCRWLNALWTICVLFEMTKKGFEKEWSTGICGKRGLL
ncbi:unnamed protein product [Prunus armeniaca]